MHIGIDLGVQRLNSNLFGVLLDEAKDLYINTVTQEFVKLALTDEKNTLYTPQTYANIREYYERLQVYIKSIQLGKVNKFGYGYVYGKLPTSITMGQLTDGVLYHGVSYKIVAKGTIDLSEFGGEVNANITNGDTFDCEIDEVSGATIAILTGEKYRIVNAHGRDFTLVGAADSLPGTEFIANDDVATGGGVSTTVQPLSKAPTWLGATLVPISDIGYYMNISTRSSVRYGNVIASGDLTVGKKYIVSTVGGTDLSGVGGVATPDVGYIFVCNTVATITWTSGTLLYEVNDNANRLVKMQDVEDFLTNSFGSTTSSPISVFADNRLRVYHDNKFTVERLFIDYIRKPITVSLSNSVNSDLPESTHSFLVDLVVEKLAALSGNPVYAAIDKENAEKENN